MTAQPPALRPLGIGEILDVSLKIVWRNFGTFMRIVLVVVLPAQALLAIVNISTVPDYRPGGSYFPTTSSSSGSFEEDDLWTFVAAGLVSLVIGFLASQFATGACFRAVAETYLGRSTDWRTSLGFACAAVPLDPLDRHAQQHPRRARRAALHRSGRLSLRGRSRSPCRC